MQIYFDNAATTAVCPEAAAAAMAAMTENYGNPSSTHALGRAAKRLLDDSRARVAAALGAGAGEVYFTSCGSEADNWAILSGAAAMKRRGRHVISSLAEHAAVGKALDELESRGFEVTRLRPNASGGVDTEAVLAALRDDTVLVSLMMVNNETGAVTDITGIASALKKAGSAALLHTDAVQAFLKMPFSAKTLGADMISISGHKIHAPKGIGALYIRRGLRLAPYILGGGQENGLRAGTEAMPQIAAFAAAAELGRKLLPESAAHMAELRRFIADRLSAEIPSLTVIGGGAAHILSVSLPGYRSEVLMNFLESRGVYVSKSSACKKGGRSHVLEAMGLDSRVIDGALRISLSRHSSRSEAEALCRALSEAHNTLVHS